MGADQPDLRAHDQLVPLCETVRSDRGMHRLHGTQVQVGRHRQIRMVQMLPVRNRGHQHPHRRGFRLRIRDPRMGHHLGLHRRRDAHGRLAQRVQRRGGPHQHRLHDRMVRHLRVEEEAGHALARHDVGVHRSLRPVELLLHLQLPAHPLVVLRSGAAACTDRRQLLLEQGRLDSEPRQHTRHLVHVRAGVPCLPGRVQVRRAVGEQPEREPDRVDHRTRGERARIRLYHVPCQEAACEPVAAGGVHGHQGL